MGAGRRKGEPRSRAGTTKERPRPRSTALQADPLGAASAQHLLDEMFRIGSEVGPAVVAGAEPPDVPGVLAEGMPHSAPGSQLCQSGIVIAVGAEPGRPSPRWGYAGPGQVPTLHCGLGEVRNAYVVEREVVSGRPSEQVDDLVTARQPISDAGGGRWTFMRKYLKLQVFRRVQPSGRSSGFRLEPAPVGRCTQSGRADILSLPWGDPPGTVWRPLLRGCTQVKSVWPQSLSSGSLAQGALGQAASVVRRSIEASNFNLRASSRRSPHRYFRTEDICKISRLCENSHKTN